ncbi:MAG: DUF4436 domain-containing protein [Actinobacteria bacterium]|nr:DUF4436 domain-containing protein [Actinomycetota bacterium]
MPARTPKQKAARAAGRVAASKAVQARERAYIRAHPSPRPFNRGDLVPTIIIAAVVTTMFIALNSFYNVDGGIRITGPGANMSQPANGLTVVIDPEEMQPATGKMSVDINVIATDTSLINTDRTLRQAITVDVITNESATEIVLPAGEIPRGTTVYPPIDGDYANYPLDKYQGKLFIRAKETKSGAQIPVFLKTDQGIYNWSTKMILPVNPTIARVAGVNGEGLVIMDMQRSTTLIIFLGLIGALVAGVTGVAVYLAGMIFTFRRVPNLTMLAWVTTALFSFLVLRSTLPGAPPLGAAIDVFLFFWAILGLMSAMLMVAIAWSRQQKAVLLEQSRPRR